MKKFYLFFLALFLYAQLNAQVSRSAVSTEMNDARFEVIQSPIIRKYTFYLDKCEGKVYQLVTTNSGGYAWELMNIYSYESNVEYTEPTYQIFLSGIVVADSYLVDTKTGRIWILVRREDDTILWEEME